MHQDKGRRRRWVSPSFHTMRQVISLWGFAWERGLSTIRCRQRRARFPAAAAAAPPTTRPTRAPNPEHRPASASGRAPGGPDRVRPEYPEAGRHPGRSLGVSFELAHNPKRGGPGLLRTHQRPSRHSTNTPDEADGPRRDARASRPSRPVARRLGSQYVTQKHSKIKRCIIKTHYHGSTHCAASGGTINWGTGQQIVPTSLRGVGGNPSCT